MFWIDECDEKTWELAGGIINNAEHVPMKPTYLKLGYAETRFLGPSRPPTENERRLFTDLDEMKTRLLAPDSYLEAL